MTLAIPMTVTLMTGATVPLPLNPLLMPSLANIKVTWNETAQVGFEVTFAFQSDLSSLLLDTGTLDAYNRMVIIITVNGVPHTIADGCITNTEYNPATTKAGGSAVVRGKGLEQYMDLEALTVGHPNLSPTLIVYKILANYAQYGIIPSVSTPSPNEMKPVDERVWFQWGKTDLSMLRYLAKQFGFIFRIFPGAVPLTNTGFWGPPDDLGTSVVGPALTAGPEPFKNIENISFSYEPLKSFKTSSDTLASSGESASDVDVSSSTRENLSTTSFSSQTKRTANFFHQGRQSTMTKAIGQGLTDRSTDKVLVGTGSLSVFSYQDVIRPPGRIELRGAGDSYNGTYRIKEVTHEITPHTYKQNFKIAREGVGSTISSVSV